MHTVHDVIEEANARMSCELESNAVVIPLRKAASYEPRVAILGIWGDMWLTRGKYNIYVAVRGSSGALMWST